MQTSSEEPPKAAAQPKAVGVTEEEVMEYIYAAVRGLKIEEHLLNANDCVDRSQDVVYDLIAAGQNM